MPNIKLPDGKKIQFTKSISGLEIAEKILMVMSKDYNLLKNIGFEGRQNVIKKFDVDKMCQTTFTEYKKLIE